MQSQEPTSHPCERVFGTCKSGDQCHYKDAPRSACVSFLKGRCRFGSACRESHFIQHEGKYISAFHPCLRVFGDCKFGEKCEYAQLPSTSCIKFLKGKCSFGTRCAEQHFGMYPGFGASQYPFALSPLQMQQQAQAQMIHAMHAGGMAKRSNNLIGHNHPSPITSSSSSITSSSSSSSPSSSSSSSHHLSANSSTQTVVLVPSKRPQQVSGQVHPCVRVFGACIAGPTCKFATIPAEACLRHLKGTCKFGDECAEIHYDTPETPGGKHPCARIFGACQSNCRFAEYPRECCLQFLKGKCKFGDQCRELHLRSDQSKD